MPLLFASSPADAVHYSGLSSRTTHQATAAVDACRYFGALLAGAVNAAPKQELLSSDYFRRNFPEQPPLCPEIERVAQGSFKHKSPPQIRGTGYVVESLEAALWAFYNDAGSFERGCLAAVNLGDDADTTGAVYGQLAGACYGINDIPSGWLSRLALRNTIETLAKGLHAGYRI